MFSKTTDDIFAAQVAVLARLIDAEACARGQTRIGGNYTVEAFREIAHIIERPRHS